MAPSSRPTARSGRSGAERAAARAHRMAATRLGSTAADHSYRLPWAQSVPRTAQEPPLPVSCIALWPLWAGALAAAAVGDERRASEAAARSHLLARHFVGGFCVSVAVHVASV